MALDPVTLLGRVQEGHYAETALALFDDANDAAVRLIVTRACGLIDDDRMDGTKGVALWHEVRAHQRIKERLRQKVKIGKSAVTTLAADAAALQKVEGADVA